MGRIWVGVMANRHANLFGLSKYAWLAKWIMSRPQNQKEAITQMAELLRVCPGSFGYLTDLS
jgi:GTP cyclohydrolase I